MLDRLVERLLDVGRRPTIVAVAGAVGVGKTTLCGSLVDALAERGRRAAVVSTDGFLLPNADLERAGLTMRKGFPESYDAALAATVLEGLRRGDRVEIPTYDHVTYDRVPGGGPVLDAAELDVVIVEGVNALQSPIVDMADVAVYIEAEADVVVGWFVARFLELCAAAQPGSFYAMFSALDEPARVAMAQATWDGINAVNLRDHIGPSRGRAHVVVRKGPDHELVAVEPSPIS